jgi:Rieske Fe-S protein
MTELDRRTVLRAACAGCAGLALAACGGGSDPADEGAAASPETSASPAAPTPLATLADLEVGKPIAVTSGRVLLTRVSETDVAAFSSKCTHQGCTVEPDGAELACPCHGSTYEAATGKVLKGPAPSPLATVEVVVRDGAVFTA